MRWVQSASRGTAEGYGEGTERLPEDFQEHMVPAPQLLDTFQAAAVSRGPSFFIYCLSKCNETHYGTMRYSANSNSIKKQQHILLC